MALKAICNYMVICPLSHECIHAKPHIPLYQYRHMFNENYDYNNCTCQTTFPDHQVFWLCPPGTPNDRICITLNEEEAEKEKIEPIAEIE